MVGLPILITGIEHGHVKANTGAKYPGNATVQIHGCKLHAQAGSGATTPGNQVFVEAFAFLWGVPAAGQEFKRTLKD